MEASCLHTKTPHFSPSLPISKARHFRIMSQPIHHRHISDLRSQLRLSKRSPVTLRECGKGCSVEENEIERELEGEMDLEEEEWNGIEWKWMEKCKGSGIVELLECLEREAIMGEDEGKEPADYSRRARIFDKSSRVFQALKGNNPPS